MAEFFVIKNESINLANVSHGVWNAAEHGLDGNLLVYVGGRPFAVGFSDPEAQKVADLLGFGDKLKALMEARKAKATADADQKAAAVAGTPGLRPVKTRV